VGGWVVVMVVTLSLTLTLLYIIWQGELSKIGHHHYSYFDIKAYALSHLWDFQDEVGG